MVDWKSKSDLDSIRNSCDVLRYISLFFKEKVRECETLEHEEQADFDKDGVDMISYELSLDVKSQSVDFKPIYSEYTK